MKLLKNNKKPGNTVMDVEVKNMIIKDLTHAYDHLNEKDRLMRFSIAKAITDKSINPYIFFDILDKNNLPIFKFN